MENFDWSAILAGATALVTFASIVVKFSPNTIDNKIVDTLLDIINVISLNNKKRSDKDKDNG